MNRVLSMSLLLAALGQGPAVAATTVSFHEDVLPILQRRCQGCHRPGEIAPMSLLTYEQARPWAKSIRSAVLDRSMPPWFADPEHGRFANDRTLPQAEIDVLVEWVKGGAREGDPEKGPPPLEWSEGWSIGEPDVILEMPVEFEVPAEGTIPYQYVRFPTGFTEDKWVERVEIRPGNRAVVHHQIASVVAHAESDASLHGRFFDLEGNPNRPGSDKTTRFSASPDSEILQVFVPGGVAPALEPGQARLVKAGSDVLMQLHYTTIGTPTTDRTRIGFIFAEEPPTEQVRSVLVFNTDFTIPPGAPNARVTAAAEVRSDLKLVSLLPHMHLRGKSFSYRAIYPDGTRETLLDVPDYDFDWQLSYYLAEPKLLPRGTILECVGHYDNSTGNPFNPDPSDEVHYGDQTWEEMLNGFMEVAIDPRKPETEIFGPAPPHFPSTHDTPPDVVTAESTPHAPAANTDVTYHRDVAPILQRSCQGCHRPGEMAPMSLLAYDEVRPWAKAIRREVLSRRMPPWGASPEHGDFVNDRSLSAEEIETMVSWVESGALAGDPKDGPEPLHFEEGWKIGTPDVVLAMPKPFEVPADGTVEYQYVVFPTGFTEDKWVERVEVRPGNPAVVHHVNAFASPPGAGGMSLLESGEFYEFPAEPQDDPDMFTFGSNGTEALHGHAPGGAPTIFPPGQARLVKAGSNIIFQLHYQSNGTDQLDQTEIAMVFAEEPPTEKITSVTVQNFAFTIPPMTEAHPIRAEAMLDMDVELVNVLPHMHLRGKSFVLRAYYPDGSDETLVHVPEYDFNWQLTYIFEQPKQLPRGTRLEAIGTFDNSPGNPSNPDPTVQVPYGEQTWNEMMGAVIDLAIDPGLESPVIFKRVPTI